MLWGGGYRNVWRRASVGYFESSALRIRFSIQLWMAISEFYCSLHGIYLGYRLAMPNSTSKIAVTREV